MNIGISDDNNKMIIMINKNNKIPLSCENIFTTSHDCQRTIDINIYEGLENDCSKNNFIGSYKIIGIPPLPKGKILIKDVKGTVTRNFQPLFSFGQIALLGVRFC